MRELDNEAEYTESTGNGIPPEPTKSYAGWVTASAFAAISTLFGVLWQVQTKSYNTAREDLKEAKNEARVQKASDSTAIALLRDDMRNCQDNAIMDLEKKMEQAKRLKMSVSPEVAKVNRDIEISKNNTANLLKATESVRKALKSQN